MESWNSGIYPDISFSEVGLSFIKSMVCWQLSSNNVIFKWEEEGEQAKQSSVESVLSASLVEKPEVRRRRQ